MQNRILIHLIFLQLARRKVQKILTIETHGKMVNGQRTKCVNFLQPTSTKSKEQKNFNFCRRTAVTFELKLKLR